MVKGNANDMQSEAQSYIVRAESVADSDVEMMRGKSINDADDMSAFGNSNIGGSVMAKADDNKSGVFNDMNSE